MTILIDLSVAGVNTGPFNLYSDADGYTSAFATNITRQQLLDGYPAVVLNGTTNIKLQSLNDICPNDTILPVNATTTTTTTTNNTITTTTTTTAAPTTTTTTTLSTSTYCYQSIWPCPDPVHQPEINSWVDYVNKYGNTVRRTIGCNPCACIQANSIVDENGIEPC